MNSGTYLTGADLRTSGRLWVSGGDVWEAVPESLRLPKSDSAVAGSFLGTKEFTVGEGAFHIDPIGQGSGLVVDVERHMD